MTQVIWLGTGAGLSDEKREHTYMVMQGKHDAIMVDCGGSPIARLIQARVPFDSIEHLILTHHHPDHLYGLSVFLLDLWLLGRKKVLHIHGLAETLRAARGMMHALEWEAWFAAGCFPVEFHTIKKNSARPIIDTPDFSVTATPAKHLLPSIATRFVDKATGRVAVYTSDTEVCDNVLQLARGADILFHEATTIEQPARGHTTAEQAGAQAQRAGVKKLVLVHLPPHGDVKKLRAAAKKNFKRQVSVSKDFARYEL